jgi:UTP-glucose-1-phosphate uridylyltransferase
VKAKTGAKKIFNIINEKKSIIINAFNSAFFLLEIMIEDKKLKHKKVIKK